MVEVVSCWHAGVHCALPSKQVVQVSSSEPSQMQLWDAVGGAAMADAERSLGVLTPTGPLWLRVTQPVIHLLDRQQLFAVPQALRDFLPLPHVVGVAELNDELLWLVDTRRLPPSMLTVMSQPPRVDGEAKMREGV